MAGTIDYNSLKSKVGSSKDWGETAQTLGQDDPQHFNENVAQVIDQHWNKLDDQTKQQLQQQPETQAAYYTLMACIQEMTQENRQSAEKAARFISQTIQQSTSGSGVSS